MWAGGRFLDGFVRVGEVVIFRNSLIQSSLNSTCAAGTDELRVDEGSLKFAETSGYGDDFL